MTQINGANAVNFLNPNVAGDSTTDGTTPAGAGTPSVTLSATSGYAAILNIASSFELLGLAAPMSPGDAIDALGELTQDLQQTLARNHALSSANDDNTSGAYLDQMLQYLSQLQTAQAAQQAAQNQANSDSSQIATNTSSIGSMNATLTSNQATITTDTAAIADIESSSAPNSDAISQLASEIDALTQADTQLAKSVSSLSAQNVTLQADLTRQNQIVAGETGDESNLYASVAQASQQFLSQAPSAGPTGDDPLSDLISLVESSPDDTLQTNLHVAQTDNLLQNHLDSNEQVALALAGSIGAAMAAMASLGALAGQDSNASPQQISGASTVVA